MKMRKLLGLAAAATTLITGAGLATTASAEPTVSFNLGAATDYVFRGIDQTTSFSEGEAFGGVDVAVDQFYAGAWLSNTGPHDFQFFEYDLYGGWKPVLGPVTLDLGFIYYGYTDSDDSVGFDESDSSNYELKVAGSIPVGGATLGGAVFWTPNFAGDNDGLDDNSGLYYEVNGAYTFSNTATLSGAVGFVDVEDFVVDSYTTWNVGVTYPITEHFSIDGRYIGTDDDADFFGSNGDTVVGTLKATF
jgi:uncharacterized protein (TIGR02001 family)